VTPSRLLADYVLKTRSGQVPVSAPVFGGRGVGRVTMGFAAPDANAARALTGQDAVLLSGIQRPGQPLARVRVVAIEPRTSRLVAEVLPGAVPEPVRPAVARALSPTRRSQGAAIRLGVPAAVLGLIVLVAIGWTLRSPVDRRCSASSDCPAGFACATWPGPAGENYRSCERTCQSDRDCPGSDQCSFIDDGPHVVRVCRSGH
jgi:hypothetical protein